MIKIVKIEQFNIDFDCNKMTPFFQSKPNNRLRFDIHKLEKTVLQNIINTICNQNEEIIHLIHIYYIRESKIVALD